MPKGKPHGIKGSPPGIFRYSGPPDQYPTKGERSNFFLGMIIGFSIGLAIGGTIAGAIFYGC